MLRGVLLGAFAHSSTLLRGVLIALGPGGRLARSGLRVAGLALGLLVGTAAGAMGALRVLALAGFGPLGLLAL
eukprot:5065138-Alexandrium_andersonii.AAC.1